VDAISRTAFAAVTRIEAGALNERSVDSLAAEFGISARHLRRAVESEFGVSPVEIAQTQRLLLAKQLLTETMLPVTEVAFASGFASVRRFNALFQQRYRLSPKALRTRRVISGASEDMLVCEAGFRPPYDWEAILGFLRARCVEGLDAVLPDRRTRETPGTCEGVASTWTERVACGNIHVACARAPASTRARQTPVRSARPTAAHR
jgi:AraC family transcriptional regulator of adaptative response / DNA-3-methyladenine glycosylase II